MTYEQALAFWFSHANFEQRTPAAEDLKLERMRALLSRLDDPHRRLRILHIAGSKGKGSTAAMLATILERAGYRTGLFTSPHLSRHEERFQVNRHPITPAELAQLLTEIRAVLDGHRDFTLSPPTFFEIATAAGFLHFVRRRVDAAVLEVGLGGRLDSTNVCQPVLSVITSISLDHTLILGDTLAQIAREKAGIIKPGRPVVSGVTAAEARSVVAAVARQCRAPLLELGRDFHFSYFPGQVTDTGIDRPRVEVTTTRHRWPELALNLLGEHQGANAAVAVASVEQLRLLGWTIPDEAVARGLAEVTWPARLEVVGRRPLVVLDCAHNVASAQALMDALQTAFSPTRRLLVFASSSDKDVTGMFEVLGPGFSRVFVTRYTTGTRSMAPEVAAGLWKQVSTAPVEVCPTPTVALRRAREEAGSADLICVTGSVYFAGEVRPMLCPEDRL